MSILKRFYRMLPVIALLGATAVSAPPAYALPTCEQEVSIRCNGYDVQGRKRLDIYYSSFQECYDTETAMRCKAGFGQLSSADGHSLTAILRKGVVDHG